MQVVQGGYFPLNGQEQPIVLSKEKRLLKGRRSGDFNAEFEFGERDGLYSEDWFMADVMSQLKKSVSPPCSHLPLLCRARLIC